MPTRLITYQPFGKAITTGTLSHNPYQFTGRENDATGLQYNRARYYHPSFQRFISQDPIGFAGGDVNLYAYTFNSPTNYTDPSGQIVPVAAIAIGCAVGAGISAGLDGLAGRKINYGDAALGCLIGAAPGLSGALARLGTVPKGIKPKVGSAGGDGAKKPFSNKVKDQARAESNDTCVFCGSKTTRQPGSTRSEIDHAIPKARGGNNSPENAQNTCRTCNRQKGAKTTEEFLDL